MSSIQNDLDPDTYIGLSLPLSHNSRDGFFNRTKTALEQTKSNIKHLLLTSKQERLGNPNFGTNLRSILFEKEGDVESAVEEEINSAISEFLPFVNITSLDVSFSNRNPNLLNVNIKFSLNVDETSEESLSLNFSNYEASPFNNLGG
jgi:phage baseplate assembly protein W|tara:strand:- start:13270 stop:13710 length:441 start_codon:yes stop_codon:yes gene_type:complete